MSNDVLSDILHSLRLKGGVYFRCEFSAPWGMEVGPTQVADFHLITRGQCWLRTTSQKNPIPLHVGDIVVFPHGDAHAVVHAPEGKTIPAEQILDGQNLEHYGPVVHGGDGLPAGILCGYFAFDRESRHPLISGLPPLIHIRGTDAHDFVWLQTAANFIAHETRKARPGADAVVNRLVEVLFIHILRAYIERADVQHGLLAAIADRRIGAALACLHREPHKPWSVASLGQQVAMSRTAFATRFSLLVGRTPMEYLAAHRMEKAKEWLRSDGASVSAVAERAGYRSEAAFSKAFKRIVGVGPGAFRHAEEKQSSSA